MEKMFYDQSSQQEVMLCQAIESERQHVLWYTGELYIFNYKGYRFYLEARGTVSARLYRGANRFGGLLMMTHDMGEWGRFYEEMSPYIKNDIQLARKRQTRELEVLSENSLKLYIHDSRQECLLDGFEIPVETCEAGLRYVLDRREEFLQVTRALVA